MEIIRELVNIEKKYSYPCVALGTFDGVHKGHQIVIESAIKKAIEKKGTSVVFTFETHPIDFILSNKTINLITTNDEKIYLLKKSGLDMIIFEKFTEEFKNLTPDEFIKNILVEKLNVKEIFIGFNYTFGKNGKGTAKYLESQSKKYNFNVTIINPKLIDDVVVSSTLIRGKIKMGKIENLKKYLGYDYILSGKVIHGKKLGRLLGFPTANINIEQKSYPPHGVYGVKVIIGDENKEYVGILNMGINPTLKFGEHSIEVHIFDFNKEIYGIKIYVSIIKFIRNEKKFNSKEELIRQMTEDVNLWRKLNNLEGI
ncbi:MAG: bifunctional riboflavin kinase/FAD synthetase [Fusobacteria bacterium]|nr:bifunctional riboflavin kinase/FAD synthetase [Fusobacteriota bacterium]